MFDLKGHVALVTGGNMGLGLGMARGLAKAGASIAIWGRNAERNASAAAELRELGADAADFACDVTDAAAVDAAMAATLERFGRLDSCFANAGGSGVRGPFLSLEPHAWRDTMDLNFHSVVNTLRAAGKHMAEAGHGGRLVVTSSVASIIGLPGGGYSSSKAAVNGLVRQLAIELGQAQITVNAILPGYIETEMSLDTPTAFRAAPLRRTPSGKIGTLEDMEAIAVFLASPGSRLMTGQCLVLDGGYTIFPM
ncbi:SDR family oxidoreductase [Novosphingobium sp.]|uniref:SDR family NAD(P)-dependent oxidoreductase n=1 Tax=Novosphingobium sp. TaxID=1874826 RepID=UPI0025DA1999|nr:SDR family oxidoreductase [Novosphingobium sp.]